jgi:hypothetical protein
MKPSWRFGLLVVVAATVLFLVWPAVSAVYRSVAAALAGLIRSAVGEQPVDFLREKDSYLLIPAIAVIIAAQGFSWRRKLAFMGGAAAGLLVFGTLITVFKLGSQPLGTLGGSDIANLPYLLFGVVFPIALVVAFVGGQPSRLWTPVSAAEAGRRCPVCGKRADDLRHHVTTAHGPDALRRGDVKRALRP